LQKSTEGAWPLTGLGTKSSRTTRMGLAPPRESVGEVKERRKPGRRWQSRDTGGGFPPIGRVARATRLGSSCRGKALWAVDAVLFDARPVEAILVPRDDSGLGLDAARGATGSVRGRTPALNARPTTPSQGGHRHAVTRSPSDTTGKSCAYRSKLDTRRQARIQPGQDCREVVRRRTGEPDLGRGSTLRSAHRSPSREVRGAPGSRAIHGCSYRESIAEVGEKHLLRAAEASREANPDGTE
jgi:hypothetical protein